MSELLLDVKNLTTSFTSDGSRVMATRDVSFSVQKSQTLAIVGESGCGKSVTALSILRLIPSPPGRIESGQILFNGSDLLSLDEKGIRKIRGNRVSMIFQEPMTSLNPVFTVGTQIAEGLRLHKHMSRDQARARTLELLKQVGINSPEQRINTFPHQLSGGMRQRVMIAMALACTPELLIADEPTTALDVTIQAQILELISRLKDELHMSVLLITHDLGVVAEYADGVVVMYAGQVVESSPVRELFQCPLHPYTAGLLASIPSRTIDAEPSALKRRLPTIEGMVPRLTDLPPGCSFAPRCAKRASLGTPANICEQEMPQLTPTGSGRSVRCHFPMEPVRVTH